MKSSALGNATIERMASFRDQGRTHSCGNSSAFLSRLRLGVLTRRDLLEYAGLKSRQHLVRDCSTVDPDTGQLVSCLADEVRLARSFDRVCVSVHTHEGGPIHAGCVMMVSPLLGLEMTTLEL